MTDPAAYTSSLDTRTPEAPQLKGQMGPIALALTVIAFAAPLASVVGVLPLVVMFGGVGAPIAFAAAMAMLLLFSVGYTAMSRYLPNPGAFYSYISAGLGQTFGLAASFIAVLGYLMVGLGIAIFFGIVAGDMVINTLHGPSLPWWLYSLALVAVVGILGYLRIDLSAKVLSVVMVLEIAIVLVFDVAVARSGGPEGFSLTSFRWDALTSGSVGVSILFAVITFLGFEATAIFREESRDPRKTIPRATYLGVSFIGVFYVLTTWLLVLAYGPSQAPAAATADPTGMFTNAMVKYAGVWAGDAISILVVTSAFAAVLSCQNIIARYCHSLGIDEALPSVLGRVHPRHGSPYVASLVLTVTMAAGILIFSGTDPNVTYAWMAGAGGFPLLFLMFLTSIAVILFFAKRREQIKDVSLWQTLVAPVLATAGLGMAVYLSATNFVALTGGNTLTAIVLQVVIWALFGAGLALALFYKAIRPNVYARIGRQQLN
ncbi:amino acid transporter [Rhizobium sp. SJZ105]|uniref:APC family permease n=1 Tax=Rhizobium sp. SJZ105 TaxID=2572678 RepID=UPI00119EB76E|nr:APC family permease [Rhizobium sp. SJZ105]TWC77229.1 amino acid transporter [Rhizobium sp. SJZ105]